MKNLTLAIASLLMLTMLVIFAPMAVYVVGTIAGCDMPTPWEETAEVEAPPSKPVRTFATRITNR